MRTGRIRCAALLALSFSLPAGARAESIAYTFTPIADTSGPFSDFRRGLPSINDGGTVSFFADLRAGGGGIFAGSGGPLTTVADTTGPFSRFGSITVVRTSINNAGTVAFSATLRAGGQGIFAGSGGPIATLYDTSGIFGDFNNIFLGPAINNNGTVVFQATLRAGGDGIFTGNGGPVTTIVVGLVTGPPSLNDAGTVVFSTFMGGAFTGSGGPLTPIATTAPGGPFSMVGGNSITSDGTVGLVAILRAGGQVVVTGSGGPLTLVADTGGPYGFLGAPSLNDQGALVFGAFLDPFPTGGFGLFTGPDPVADRVIAEGDLLFGSRVTAFAFASTDALNNAGQIAFIAFLADGRQVLVRADPLPASAVPEPTALTLLGIGLIGMAACGRRRGWLRRE